MHDTVSHPPTLSPLQHALQQADTSCIKCGFCLPTCPTYRLTGNEAASPRGRIDLMQAVAEGTLEAQEIAAPLEGCLGCRACETACPAGVAFGRLLEAGRAQVYAQQTESSLATLVRRWCLQTLLTAPYLLHVLAHLLAFYQRSGVQRWLRTSGLLQRCAPALARMEELLPVVPAASARRPLPPDTPPVGEAQGCVALLTGCVMPELLPAVHDATVRVLAANGYRVLAPPRQRCCGALQVHAGEYVRAQHLARHNIAVFEATDAAWIVVNAAGCGATMKDYGHLLADDPAYAARAAAFSQRVRDISEVLAAAPLRGTLHPLPVRVAYDDPCHLLHGQKIHAQPRALLQCIPELQLLDVPESDWCCGSAGIYNLTQPETAQALLDRKMTHLAALQPHLIVTGNPGCILQLRQGVARHGLTAEVLHPIEVLARAYGPRLA